MTDQNVHQSSSPTRLASQIQIELNRIHSSDLTAEQGVEELERVANDLEELRGLKSTRRDTQGLMSSLPILAVAFGRKHGIKVSIGGGQACTDGKNIQLPSLPMESPHVLRAMVLGFLYHETGHIETTDMGVFKKAQKESPLLRNLLNVVEDIRMEAWRNAKYPGSAAVLRDLTGIIQASGAFGKLETIATAPPSEVLAMSVLTALRSQELGQPVQAVAALWRQRFIEEFGEALALKVDVITTGAAQLKDTAAALKMARQLATALKEEQERQEQEQQKQEQEKQQEQEGESSPDSEKKDDNEDSSSESGDDSDSKDGSESEDDAKASDDDSDAGDGAADGADGDSETDKGSDDDAQASDDGSESGDGSKDGAEDDSQDGNESTDGAQASDDGSDTGEESGDDTGQGGESSDDAQASDGDANTSSSGAGGDNSPVTPEQQQALKEAIAGEDEEFGETDLGEMMKELLEAAAEEAVQDEYKAEGHFPVTTPCTVEVGANTGRNELALVAEASQKLRIRLAAKLQADARTKRNHVDKGQRLDGRMLHRLFTNDSRVFLRKEKKRDFSTAVQILLDRSGSMSGDKIEIARQATLAVALGLGQIPRVKTAACAFPSILILKQWEERVQQAANRFPVDVCGSTPMAEAMLWGAANLASRREERKLMIVITDGAPDNAQGVKTMMRKLTQNNVECIGVGIGHEAVKHLFPQWVVINSVDELALALFNVVGKNLTGERIAA